MPSVVMQVMPEIAHASVASGYLIADDAVWCENVITAGTYTDPETVGAMTLRCAPVPASSIGPGRPARHPVPAREPGPQPSRCDNATVLTVAMWHCDGSPPRRRRRPRRPPARRGPH